MSQPGRPLPHPSKKYPGGSRAPGNRSSGPISAKGRAEPSERPDIGPVDRSQRGWGQPPAGDGGSAPLPPPRPPARKVLNRDSKRVLAGLGVLRDRPPPNVARGLPVTLWRVKSRPESYASPTRVLRLSYARCTGRIPVNKGFPPLLPLRAAPVPARPVKTSSTLAPAVPAALGLRSCSCLDSPAPRRYQTP